MSGGHGAVEGSNKRVALLISVLALFLAFSETLGKAAQTDALSANIEASNQWAYFQARTIRSTVLKTADEAVALLPPGPGQEAIAAKRAEWAKTMARWESEPSTGEGRKELAEKAKAAQVKRDLSLERYHHYELASAAFQIGIVLASAEVITGIAALMFAGGLLGIAGAVMLGFGFFAPHALHLFH
jgi:ketosteroid isomerase-like protein